MKSNIDLTDTEIFSRNRFNGIDLFLPKVFGTKFPWKMDVERIDSDEELGESYRGMQYIFPLGNRERRQFIRECIEMDSGEHCDCCGVSLVIIPWNRTFGLCKRCQKRMEDDVINKKHKFPWVKREEMKADRNRMFR